MRKQIAIFMVFMVFVLLVVPLSGCSWLNRNSAIAADKVDERLVLANTDFAFRLFAQLLSDQESENVFISPASIALALSMTYNGAAGKTKSEMAEVMAIRDLTLDELNAANKNLLSILRNPDKGVQTSIANSLWPAADADLIEEFVARNKEFYNAEASRVDFRKPEAVDKINKWVADNTNNRIKKLFEELSPTTRLVLVNALFFKGTWTTSFDKKLTADTDFFLADGSKKTVSMMYRQDTLSCLEGDGFKAIRLPYGKDRVSMFVFVPETDLSSFTAKLTPGNWNEWLAFFIEIEEATIYLPRFSAEYKAELNDPLQNLGMVTPFSGSADFSGMTPGGGWFISLIVHQANIDVNEEGTEAAAATGVVKDESAPLNPFVLRADKPFFMAIVDDLTDTILFMGAINNPQ